MQLERLLSRPKRPSALRLVGADTAAEIGLGVADERPTPTLNFAAIGALHGSLRHSVGGRDPQEGDDEDADNSFGRRGFGPRWADVAPAQARCGGTPVAGGGS